jgi:hypothetical protein
MVTLDNRLLGQLEGEVRKCGIRLVLHTLAAATDVLAGAAGGNFNLDEARQWATWGMAIETLARDRKLTDPIADDSGSKQ